MDNGGAIVLQIPRPYRKIAQENWGLTDEQMKGMHVHHRIPQSQGGTNDPSNLYVCSQSFHAHVWHGKDSFHPLIEWCSENGKKGGKASYEKNRAEGLLQWIKDGRPGLTPEQIAEVCSRGGKKGGKVTGQKHKRDNTGIFGRTAEERKNDRRKGVQTQIQTKSGIFNPDNPNKAEWARLGNKAVNSQKWVSLIDGYISTAAGIYLYHKARGWDTTAKAKLN
jgi:hypothetical protein